MKSYSINAMAIMATHSSGQHLLTLVTDAAESGFKDNIAGLNSGLEYPGDYSCNLWQNYNFGGPSKTLTYDPTADYD